MRVANIAERLSLIVDDNRAVDVESASDGTFAADVQAVFPRWADFGEWARSASLRAGSVFADDKLDAGSQPPQVFAIGLNYREHATESGARFAGKPYAPCVRGMDPILGLDEPTPEQPALALRRLVAVLAAAFSALPHATAEPAAQGPMIPHSRAAATAATRPPTQSPT